MVAADFFLSINLWQAIDIYDHFHTKSFLKLFASVYVKLVNLRWILLCCNMKIIS